MYTRGIKSRNTVAQAPNAALFANNIPTRVYHQLLADVLRTAPGNAYAVANTEIARVLRGGSPHESPTHDNPSSQ